MGLSSFPNGFSSGILVRGIPLTMAHPGNVYWVSNSSVLPDKGIGGSNSNDGSFLRPFSTIDYAVGMCKASRGDIIMVKPGHVETVSAAAGLAIDVIGVAIIGLGVGSLRPKVNLTATASTVTMSAANCTVQNILFTGGIDAIVSMIVVSAADCSIQGCELRDVTGQMTVGILTTAAADRLKILDHVHNGDTAAGTGAAIAIVGGDRIEITAEVIDGNFSVGAIDIRTTATTNLHVHDIKRVFTRNAADIIVIDTITASTGQIGPWINGRLTDNAANITEAFTGATFVYMQPLNLVNLAGESSMFSNIAASTDA
jgi:hypothetical protein